MDWDEKYSATEDYLFGETPNSFLVDCFESKLMDFDFSSSKKALVLGCGEGRNLAYLASKGFESTGVDRSKIAQLKSRQLLEKMNLRANYYCDDVLRWDNKDTQFDLVVMIWLHLPTGAREEVFSNIKSLLSPVGVLLIESFRPPTGIYKKMGPPSIKILLELEQLTETFSDFNILHARELDRELAEGSGHNGMAELVQFVAQKNRGI